MFKKLTYRFLILLALVFVLDRGVGKYLDHLYEKNRCDYSNGKINAFLDAFDSANIIEVSRTGVTGISRGKKLI